MTYFDGFLVPVPTAHREKYREVAQRAADIFREYGAIRIVETWGDDIPRGKTNDFFTAVIADGDEQPVFSFIEWPSKEMRDAAWPKIMEDERMKPDHDNMPFDGKRMIYGGFASIVDVAGE